MRGKLVFFVLLLAVSGLVAGWKVAHDPQCFIGGGASPAELAANWRRCRPAEASIFRGRSASV